MKRKKQKPLIREAGYVEFMDSTAARMVCSINAGPKDTGLWLGIDTRKGNGRAMFLRQDKVVELVARLNAWLDTGSLMIDQPDDTPQTYRLPDAKSGA